MFANWSQSELLLPITQAIITSLDPDDVLEILVQQIGGLDGVRAAAVFEADETASGLRVRCSHGLSKSYVRSLVIPFGSLAVGRAFQSGQVEVITDIDLDPSFAPMLRRAHREHFEAIVGVPLVARQRLLGILAIYLQREYSPEAAETSVIRTLGNLAAVALDNARLFQAQSRTTRELESLSQQAARQSDVLRQTLRAHEWLVQTVLARDGLQALTEALAQLADAPIVIEDTNLNLLSYAHPGSALAGQTATTQAVGLAGFRTDARVTDHLTSVKAGRRPSLLPAIPDIGLGTARITGPVFLGGSLLAYISILATDRDFSQNDFTLSEQGALAVALELMKARVAFEAEQRMRGDFLQSLLAGKWEVLDESSALMAATKFDPAGLQRVLVVQNDGEPDADQTQTSDGDRIIRRSQLYRAVERTVLERSPKSIVIAAREKTVVLLSDDRELSDLTVHALGERIVAAIATSLVPISVSVGVGGPCRHIKEVPRSFNEANRALEYGRALAKRGFVVDFSGLGIFEILLKNCKTDDLSVFADRYVARLKAYDRKYGGGLMVTLEVYVRRNLALADTARELYLHPNTIKYRLRKIEELCGVDLHDAEDLMNLQIALRLSQIAG